MNIASALEQFTVQIQCGILGAMEHMVPLKISHIYR